MRRAARPFFSFSGVSSLQMPPQIAPYQLRLDWQMWFAAMSTPNDYP
jgi:hypothetical protein